MDPENVLRPLILVAIASSDYRVLIRTILGKDGFDVLMAGSVDEALSLIQSHRISGIVVTSDIAIAEMGDEPAKLMSVVGGKIPTVTLITPSTWGLPNVRWVFDMVYGFSRQDYIHMPVGAEEVLTVLKKVMGMEGKNRVPSARYHIEITCRPTSAYGRPPDRVSYCCRSWLCVVSSMVEHVVSPGGGLCTIRWALVLNFP